MTSRSEVDSILNMQMQQALSAPFPKGAVQMFVGDPPKKALWMRCNGHKIKTAAFPELAKRIAPPGEGEEQAEDFTLPHMTDEGTVKYWIFSGEPLIEDYDLGAPAAGA